MKEQFKEAFDLIAKQDIDGVITGSYMLGYHKDWHQDLDVFVYNEQSFRSLLYFMHYNPMFLILDKLEKHKFDEYIKHNKSGIDKIGLITIKFYWNTCVPVNVIFKKFHHTIFDVLSNFDLELIATGHDIKSGKVLSLRETTGMIGSWNTWNNSFYQPNYWSVKRLCRQFERVVKYESRGYDLSSVTNKYIELVENILEMENVYTSEKGTAFHENTKAEFQIVLKILQTYKKEGKISEEALQILKTII